MLKGMLVLRDFSPLNLICPDFALKRHAPLWLMWISVLSCLALFLPFQIKILEICGFPTPCVPPGFLRSWWVGSLPPLSMRVLVVLCSGGWLDYCLWKSLKNSNWTKRKSLSTEKILCEKEIRQIRYDHPFFINLMITNDNIFIYKYHFEQLRFCTSNFISTKSIFVTVLLQSVFKIWIFPSAMAPLAPPGKEKDKENHSKFEPDDGQNYLSNKGKISMKMDSQAQAVKSHDQQINGEINSNCIQDGKMDIRNRSSLEGPVLKEDNLTMGLLVVGEPSSKPPKSVSLDHKEPVAMTLADLHKEEEQLHSLEEELQDYDEAPFDYEYDDLLVEEPGDINNPTNYFEEGQPIMISNDPPFSEKDLDDFINNEVAINLVDPPLSEGTFHSMNNSFISSSSFVNGMERLIVHQPVRSESTSSKRKMIEGIEDTATSDAREGKRARY